MLSDEVKQQCELNRQVIRGGGGDGHRTIRMAGWCANRKARTNACECGQQVRRELDFDDDGDAWRRIAQDDS